MADEKKYYCGIGPIPRGQKRGSAAYCIRNNQVRYYGLEEITEKQINKYKGTSNDLQKEEIKLKKLEYDAMGIVREAKNVKFAMEQDGLSNKKRDSLEKKLDELREKRDKIKIKLTRQRDVVATIKEDQEKSRKRAEKSDKKSDKKKGDSGSKKSRK